MVTLRGILLVPHLLEVRRDDSFFLLPAVLLDQSSLDDIVIEFVSFSFNDPATCRVGGGGRSRVRIHRFDRLFGRRRSLGFHRNGRRLLFGQRWILRELLRVDREALDSARRVPFTQRLLDPCRWIEMSQVSPGIVGTFQEKTTNLDLPQEVHRVSSSKRSKTFAPSTSLRTNEYPKISISSPSSPQETNSPIPLIAKSSLLTSSSPIRHSKSALNLPSLNLVANSSTYSTFLPLSPALLNSTVGSSSARICAGVGKGIAVSSSAPPPPGAEEPGAGRFSGRWGKKSRTNLCVMERAASQDTCWPIMEVTRDLRWTQFVSYGGNLGT